MRLSCSVSIVRSDWLMATNSRSARSAAVSPARRVARRPEGERRVGGARQARAGRRRALPSSARTSGLSGGSGAVAGRAAAPCSARSRIGPRRPWRCVSLRLALEQFADLGLHQLLVEHLAAGDAVDLRAQRRDAVLIGLLQARLPRGRGVDQVVPEHEIGGREQVADGDRRERRAGERGKPRSDLEMADVVAARDDDRVRFLALCRRPLTDSSFTERASIPLELRHGRLHIVRVNKALSKSVGDFGCGRREQNEALAPRSVGTRAVTRARVRTGLCAA